MADKRAVSIYGLLDEQRQIRYVGYSSDPAWRARKHWRERGSRQTGSKNPQLNLWLRALGEVPDIHIFEQVPYEYRYAAEQYWTDLLRGVPGVVLLNIASGARLPVGSYAKIGDAHRGRTIASEHRDKISRALTGRQVSEETRVRLRDSHLGKTLSPESIAKRSGSVRGAKRSAEVRKRMSLAAQEREATARWCADCSRSWSVTSWPRHIRKYHEGGKW